MRRRESCRGFTLVEILLVIVILGLLATVAVVSLRGTRESAEKKTTKLTIQKVMRQIELYRTEIGSWPGEEGLKALMTKPDFGDDTKKGEKWHRFIESKEELKDAWGHDLMYKLEEEDSGGKTIKVPHVWSIGPNGNDEQGEGDDIKSWETEEAE